MADKYEHRYVDAEYKSFYDRIDKITKDFMAAGFTCFPDAFREYGYNYYYKEYHISKQSLYSLLNAIKTEYYKKIGKEWKE